MTMTLVSTQTVGAGGAASIEWTGIPQTGTDLLVVLSGRSTSTTGTVYLEFNGLTTNLSSKQLTGDGSAPFSSSSSSLLSLGQRAISISSDTANSFGNNSVYIANYASNTNKPVSIDTTQENNGVDGFQSIVAGLWASTSAITSVKLVPYASNNFAQYTTASLYIITKGGTGTLTPAVAKATGGTVTFSGGYFIHKFTSSGTFTPSANLTVAALMVAGGGGGGSGQSYSTGAGGGGAGGAKYVTGLSCTNGTGYTVTVGAGGASNYATRTATASTFNSYSATPGGNGMWPDVGVYSSRDGGSGGGASGGSQYNQPGSGVSGEGFGGGGASSGTSNTGGGGGGGSNIAGDGAGNSGGSGGAGKLLSAYNSVLPATNIAGGGGGGDSNGGSAGSGGAGGGGRGADTGGNGTAGTVNTGGGGGGSFGSGTSGGTGGSGIVYIIYAA